MASKKVSLAADDLTQIYQERGVRLRAIGSRAGRQDAADVVQEAVLRTVEAKRVGTVNDTVRFLFRVVRNLAIDRLRFRRRVTDVFPPNHSDHDAADEGANPERVSIASERLKRVLAVIERMPARRREAFVLHRFEDLSYIQIARRMGVSVKMVEKHLALAMEQLHEELDD